MTGFRWGFINSLSFAGSCLFGQYLWKVRSSFEECIDFVALQQLPMTLAVLLGWIAHIGHDLHRVGVWLSHLEGNQRGVLGLPVPLPVFLLLLTTETTDAKASAANDGHGALVNLAVRHFAVSLIFKLQLFKFSFKSSDARGLPVPAVSGDWHILAQMCQFVPGHSCPI